MQTILDPCDICQGQMSVFQAKYTPLPHDCIVWLFLLQTLSKGDNLYEIYYNGKLVTTTDANEAGAFLKDNF